MEKNIVIISFEEYLKNNGITLQQQGIAETITDLW